MDPGIPVLDLDCPQSDWNNLQMNVPGLILQKCAASISQEASSSVALAFEV